MGRRFEKVRFFITVVLCLGVIISCALWSRELQLQDAAASAQAAAAPAPLACRPVPGNALRGFSAFDWDETLQCFASHQAIDFEAAHQTPVLAAQAGTVITSRRDRLWGGIVEIEAENGDICRYAALEWPAAVQEGQRVSVGDTLGTVGEALCEAALPPHLHFAWFVGGMPTEPVFN